MKIKPDDIEIPHHDPFRHDLLDRKQSILTLTNLLQYLETPYTMSIDASWGNGKTTFLNMWKQYLCNEDFPVTSFNAWETDFAGNPFVALSSELLTALELHKGVKPSQLKRLRKHAFSLGYFILVKGIPGAVSLAGVAVGAETHNPFIPYASGVSANILSSIMNKFLEKFRRKKFHTPITYADAKSQIKSFRKNLGDAAKSLSCHHDHKPLVIIIDELDRCRPSYAVELLEIAKHFFSVKNIVFVLAIDKSQLAHAIKAIYGNEFDANGYLRRFIDLHFQLPTPDRNKSMESTLDSTEIPKLFDQNPDYSSNTFKHSQRLLFTFLDAANISLRQLQQTLYRFGLIVSSLGSPSIATHSSVALFLILKTIAPDTYNEFVTSKISDMEVSNQIFEMPEISNIKTTLQSARFNALLIIAQHEFALTNRPQREVTHDVPSVPTLSILHTCFLGNSFENSNDPLLQHHAEQVLRDLESLDPLLKMIREGSPAGFALAAEHTELLFHTLPDEPPAA